MRKLRALALGKWAEVVPPPGAPRHVFRPFVALTGTLVFMIALAAWPAESDASSILKQTFNDPTPTANDQFGRSVAIDGNKVLIGAVSFASW